LTAAITVIVLVAITLAAMITKLRVMDRSREIKKDWVGGYYINVSENGRVEIKEDFQKKFTYVSCFIRFSYSMFYKSWILRQLRFLIKNNYVH
jgi:hypothetical protein